MVLGAHASTSHELFVNQPENPCIFGGASACASVATVRSSKSRFAMDEYTVRAIYTGHVQQTSSPWR